MGEQYQQIIEFENLYRAYRKARLGKRHQESVANFEHFLEGELFALQEELQNQTYHPGAYRSFYRTEAKRRLISAAPFRDRVVNIEKARPLRLVSESWGGAIANFSSQYHRYGRQRGYLVAQA